jgi:uncharacterized protein YciI
VICVELSFTDEARRLAQRPAHRVRLDELGQRGSLLAAGPFSDDAGALLVFTCDEPAVRAELAADPDYSAPGVRSGTSASGTRSSLPEHPDPPPRPRPRPARGRFDRHLGGRPHPPTGRQRRPLDMMGAVDETVTRALLRALAEHWPEGAGLERIVVHERRPRRVVVTLWTSSPGAVVGRRGSAASALRDRLREAAPGHGVELRIELHASAVGEVPLAGVAAVDATTADSGSQAHDLVPDLVGLAVGDARAKAHSSGFSIATGDPDGAPISFYVSHGHWVVTAQVPLPGVLAPLHSPIVVEIEERGGGGESGDREPLVPQPPGGRAREEERAPIEGAQERVPAPTPASRTARSGAARTGERRRPRWRPAPAGQRSGGGGRPTLPATLHGCRWRRCTPRSGGERRHRRGHRRSDDSPRSSLRGPGPGES